MNSTLKVEVPATQRSGMSILSRATSKCKGPEVAMSMMYRKNICAHLVSFTWFLKPSYHHLLSPFSKSPLLSTSFKDKVHCFIAILLYLHNLR